MPGLRMQTEQATAEIRNSVRGIAVLLSVFPSTLNDNIYNSCAVFQRRRDCCAQYRKQLLPNYSVFDEERYFAKGKDAGVFRLGGIAYRANYLRGHLAARSDCCCASGRGECIIVHQWFAV